MSDLIDRQAALDTLNGIKITKGANWYEFYQKALTAVGELPPAQPGWIPCSERDPEKNGFYLVTTKAVGWNCKEYTDVDTSYYGDGIWYRKRVLAWMPLPKPWEGEKP